MEIGVFRSWERRWTATGVGLMPKVAPAAAYIHIAPRASPIRSVKAIVETARRELAERARDTRVTHAERLVTREGEHAAIVSLSAATACGPMRRDLGVVFGEDFHAVVDAAYGVEHEPMFMTLFDPLVREFPLLAGYRWRRVELTAPLGWAPRSRGLLTQFYAPTYQRDRSLLSVPPAAPLGTDTIVQKIVHEDLLASFTVREGPSERPVEGCLGLTGKLVALRGDAEGHVTYVQAVMLADDRYAYTARLESRSPIDPDDVLLPLARSIRPVPKVGATSISEHRAIAALWHYSD
ncbi:MAG: hypothetical protein ACM31C_18460 [Acidobacteriota bacterium]